MYGEGPSVSKHRLARAAETIQKEVRDKLTKQAESESETGEVLAVDRLNFWKDEESLLSKQT